MSVHDCVIIPGFGGFIGNYSPAQIDPVHHAFRPPMKKLLFNINLKQNDGLLATCVSTLFGASYDDACVEIESFVQQCKTTLKSGKPFIIPDVGRLYSGREGNIQFEQDKNSNLLPESFGLTPFISPPMERIHRPVKSSHSPASRTQNWPEKRWMIPHSLRWAAVLAIPIGIAAIVGVTQYDKTGSGKENNAGIFSEVLSRFSSASLVDKKEAPTQPSETLIQYESTPSVFDQTAETEESAPTEREIVNTLQDRNLSASKTVVEPETVGHPGDAYAVIIGAFKSKENAKKLIAQLQEKGTVASIFDRSRTGLFRVTIGTFSQREEALQLLSSAKSSDFSGAWLLTK
ncbi:MAG: SPOR domain-containing protein [Bacteroidales bacterium]|nr:SPOR domain-containing protein [Bacteroidales bacterium]